MSTVQHGSDSIRKSTAWVALVFIALVGGLAAYYYLLHRVDANNTRAEVAQSLDGVEPHAADREVEPLTALETLLAKEWPAADLWLDAEAAPVLSREDFVRASQSTIDVRQQMLSRAYPATYNEAGQPIVLGNHRFFSVDIAEQGNTEEVVLFLHYPGMTPDIEPPIVRLLQYELEAGDPERANLVVPVEPAHDALLLRLKDTGGVLGGWMVHVSTVNALAKGPSRFFILLHEADNADS